MKYRLRVYHKKGSGVSRYDFPGSAKVAAWNHFHLYCVDIDQGYFDRVEMWIRDRGTVATGDRGEEVWQLKQRYPEEN